ncbi:hypothetical protein [Pseudorhodoplanes sinuspersici]|uniref:Uncharacterized protein n=1 Tax=Pseudorhodoplanes sinuspersici TaxID=1235591 RepID=A0A1W6ZLP8_9HYPH|nr:hypothetical protein [Pseudorhodoplanes sinuspersici]ARP98195.1 hypothetical protein CAK95_03160 [Pseudorhodoplanes sinuspersici]RKE68049.1 hypothetical protein DFP91_4405 [Pseudorhodoplanes sinuspersici]
MTSKREQVLDAVKALVAAALPGADVKRNLAKAERIPPDGLVIVRDGDPGEPEVLLSPLLYVYTHRIPVEVAAYETSSQPRAQVLDEMLGAIGTAVAGDRTLGGLCDFIEAEAPATDDVETAGARAGRWADAAIVAVYGTTDPLN